MSSGARRLAVVGAVMALAGLIGVVPADAGGSPLVVSPPEVAPGGTFTVQGTDCIDNTLTVSVAGLALSKTVEVLEDVPWSLSFTVPPDATLGTYDIVVTNEECTIANGSVVVAVPESISLKKTVGTTPGACATTTTISVVPGTTVYYCYTVTNNTQSLLATHSLTDDKLGALLTNVMQDLPPGASANTVALGKTVSAVVNATTTNTATWTALVGQIVERRVAAQQAGPFTATAGATVTVTAAPAVAAAAIPNFTG